MIRTWPEKKTKASGDFTKGQRKRNRVGDSRSQLKRDCEIRIGNSRGIGCNHSANAITKPDQEVRSAETNGALKYKIDGKTEEAVGALNVAATASKRDIEGRSDGEKSDQGRVGQVQVIRNLLLKHEQHKGDNESTCPGA